MDSNTHSAQPPGQAPDDLAALAMVTDQLATQRRDHPGEMARAERALVLRRLVERLEATGSRNSPPSTPAGPAGADHDQQLGSTAGWLRHRLQMSSGTATRAVRTAQALSRGPLAATAQALTSGAISVAHAQVVASGTIPCPTR